jgi:lipid A 4'-phosphatase
MKAIAVYIGLVVLAVPLFLFVPQVDLATSQFFYNPGSGFILADWPPVVLLERLVPWITWCWLVLVLGGAAWLFLVGRPLWRLDRKALAFLFASLALGPGLLANTLLKDHWGRARPTQIEAFGGLQRFTPAPLPAAECERNCAFVSGHAALGFSLVAFGFLLPPGRSRNRGVAAALGFGALVGFGRIIQGGHFLSDVVYAGLILFGTTAFLYWWIVQCDGLALSPLVRLYHAVFHKARIMWAYWRRAGQSPTVRSASGTAAAIIVIVISIKAIDRPLAVFFHARDADLHSLFELIGRLGLTYGYLTLTGLGFVILQWGGLLPRLRPFASRMRARAVIPAFLFLSIAASGVIVDILKVVLGRARPKLLFQSDIFGFTYLGWHADHWSFPSGHSATIVALMTALWYLWPQHVLFYIVIAAIVAGSRVVVGAHYLGDALAGALIAVLTTRFVARVFARRAIDLVAARQGLDIPEGALPR